MSVQALVFYDSGISFFAMFIYWLAVASERTGSVQFLGDHPLQGLGIILAGSTTAFAYNITLFYFTLLASARHATRTILGRCTRGQGQPALVRARKLLEQLWKQGEPARLAQHFGAYVTAIAF